MALDVAALLKLAPLATKQLQRYRRSDPSKSLDRLVRAEFESDPELGPRTTDALLQEWFYLHNDPRGAVLIAGLLRDGDLAYLEALRIRSGELLAGLEAQPLGAADTIDRLIAAVAHNFLSAQKDATEATQTGASAVLSAIGPLATREDLEGAIGHLERSLTPAPPRVLLLATSFDDKQRQHLDALIPQDAAAAGRLGELLDGGETSRLVEVVRAPPPWATEQPASFWQTAARVLVDAGQLDAAEQAFVREANSPGVEDRVAALVSAARCAEADPRPGADAAAERHLAAATAIRSDHPMVQLFLASRVADAQQRLDLTDAVAVTTPRQIAQKEAQRATALVALRRYEETHAAAAASTLANPNGGGRELAALATILEAREKLPSRDRDDRPLMDAVAYQLSLYHEARDIGRNAMGGVAGARAALGTAVLGDQPAARELIDQISGEPSLLVEEEARTTLFEAALSVGSAERARALLPPTDGSPESRLPHATVAVLDGNNRAQEAAELDTLLAEIGPGNMRTQVVLLRVLAADDPTIPLDPAIVDGIEHGERLIAHAEAARALARKDLSAARAALAAFDDPASLSLRSEVAERDDALPEAIGLQATLTRQQPTARNLLHLASLRARSADYSGAIRDAMRLATDDRKLPSARDNAYAVAAQAAIEGGEFEELEDISERWIELSPDRKDPLWAHTFALARQNRHAEALEFARGVDLEPSEEANRHVLWAELLMYGLPEGPERMRALMELSDKFGRPLELEQAFIGGVLKTPSSERGEEDPEVIARFQEALTTFEERFPASSSLKKITVDPEGGSEALIDQLAAVQPRSTQEQVDARQEAIDGVRKGQTAVAFVAAMVNRGTVETLVRNGAHPLAVFDRATVDAETAAAAHALDQAAASWDETACATVAELPNKHVRRIEALLPGSTIGQAVRDALADGVRAQLGGEPVAFMQVMPDGTPRIVEENPALGARVRRVELAADQLASRFAVTPDRSAGGDDRLAALLARDELVAPMAALVSALLTAKSAGVPVFSDDRVVRAYARALDLPAFGTVALIDAATQRGLVDVSEGQAILDATIDLGVWSAALLPEDYVAVARRAEFDLERCARPLVADEALLRVDPRILHNARLLAAVAIESPDRLSGWAETIVRAYQELLKLDPALVTSLLAAAQFDPNQTKTSDAIRARNMAVIVALRYVADFDSAAPGSDPLIAGLGRWLHTVSTANERAIAVENLLDQVDQETSAVLRDVLSSEAEGDDEHASGA